jgi:tRNA (adenine22-N1)-methyltransferase
VKKDRISCIINQIRTKSVVVDVGSDHAQLAIKLLKANKATHVYNVELNKQPYLTTITNLQKNGLLAKTTNFLANGLQITEVMKPVDYCVIAGMGSKNIVDILQCRNKEIKIKTFIFVPNNLPNILRKYLEQNGYKISYEEIVKDGQYYYPLMVVSQDQGLVIKDKYEIYFGPYNLKHPSLLFRQMYQQRFAYIQANQLHLRNHYIAQEFNLLKEHKI